MAELWDLLDAERNRTGKTLERGKPIPKGYYHIIIEVWTMLPDGRLLLTKRHPDKPMFPEMWEGTAGSVVAGESSLQGAIRELSEETGLHALPEQMTLLGTEQTDCDFLDSYLYRCPETEPKLCLQAEEVTEAAFIPLEELDGWKEKITPPAWEHFVRDREKLKAAAEGRIFPASLDKTE